MSRRLLITELMFLFAALGSTLRAATNQEVNQQKPVCNGKFKGRKPNATELREILRRHRQWVLPKSREGEQNPQAVRRPDSWRANLCGALLDHVDLSSAKLGYADLSNAILANSDLDSADLYGAQLVGAALVGARLKKANLESANLSRANLMDANLEAADLQSATLDGAILMSVNLKHARLIDTHVEHANILEGQLDEAVLFHASFIGTDLMLARLNRADLSDADLSDARLVDADLSGTTLRLTRFKNAQLAGANLTDAVFELDPYSLPDIVSLASAKNLSQVRFLDTPSALTKIRGEFKALGLRDLESQLTYAIRHSEMQRKIKIKNPDSWLTGKQTERYEHTAWERGFNYVLFDFTCRYGMSPGRALILLIRLAGICSVFYLAAQLFPRVSIKIRGGIWAVWDTDRVCREDGQATPERLTRGFPAPKSQVSWLRRTGRASGFNAVFLALYFSMLSALRIGWKEFNLGDWLSRMQPREYDLRATGWVRVVSGLQSLVSVYLFALSILSYFGTPFE